MAKSILTNEKECFVCKTTQNLHDHHVFYGTANRKISERYGYKVWLCQEHHTGNNGVHFNRSLDIWLKSIAQTHFEITHTRDEFIKTFGKSYL